MHSRALGLVSVTSRVSTDERDNRSVRDRVTSSLGGLLNLLQNPAWGGYWIPSAWVETLRHVPRLWLAYRIPKWRHWEWNPGNTSVRMIMPTTPRCRRLGVGRPTFFSPCAGPGWYWRLCGNRIKKLRVSNPEGQKEKAQTWTFFQEISTPWYKSLSSSCHSTIMSFMKEKTFSY